MSKAAGKAGPSVDPLAIQVTRDMNLESSKVENDAAKWEHEDLAHVRIKVFRDHTESVNRCRFFAEDTRLLSASEDCSIKIWDRENGTVLRTLDNAHKENAADVSCSEEGDKMVSCGWDHVVHSWDVETGQPIWSNTTEDIITCCHLSHDGRLACIGTDLNRDLMVYDLVAGELVNTMKEYHNSTLTTCMFSPMDDRIITTSYDMTAKFFDLRSNTCTITLDGHANVVTCGSITKDERKFATSSWDKSVCIWDISTGMYRSRGPTLLKGSHEGSISSCHLSSDGLMLVSGSYDRSIVVLDVEHNIQKLKLQGHSSWVNDVRISGDQNWLLSCSKDMTVRLWNIEDADRIPVVVEARKAGGLKVIKCSSCEKPFSMSETAAFQDKTICVFCRMKSPEQTCLHSVMMRVSRQTAFGPRALAVTCRFVLCITCWIFRVLLVVLFFTGNFMGWVHCLLFCVEQACMCSMCIPSAGVVLLLNNFLHTNVVDSTSVMQGELDH
ncbi:hypothetical protein BaRGS_00033217 [Batillaria attramentaria]|uniref:Uncharacterized protein n=1 Tax=Batillaria attramentaria TaxID=370345 RepID=A0ABD0JLD8_9CAEN